MAKRKVPAGAVRKGVRITKNGPVVVTTRKPKSLSGKIADALLKKTGR